MDYSQWILIAGLLSSHPFYFSTLHFRLCCDTHGLLGLYFYFLMTFPRSTPSPTYPWTLLIPITFSAPVPSSSPPQPYLRFSLVYSASLTVVPSFLAFCAMTFGSLIDAVALPNVMSQPTLSVYAPYICMFPRGLPSPTLGLL